MPNEKTIEKLANLGRLDRFSDISQIDNIVKESHGAYTHDKAFELPVEFAYSLTLMQYEKSMYAERHAKWNREINKSV